MFIADRRAIQHTTNSNVIGVLGFLLDENISRMDSGLGPQNVRGQVGLLHVFSGNPNPINDENLLKHGLQLRRKMINPPTNISNQRDYAARKRDSRHSFFKFSGSFLCWWGSHGRRGRSTKYRIILLIFYIFKFHRVSLDGKDIGCSTPTVTSAY